MEEQKYHSIYDVHYVKFSEDKTILSIPIIDMHKNLVGYTIVDGSLWQTLLQYSYSMWTVNGKSYVRSSSGKRLHHLIMGEEPPEDHIIDHINGD